MPEEFGNVPREEIAAYGPVLGRYYEFLDEQISTLMRAAGDETVLMVVSAHGVEPSSLAERLGWRLERRSGAGTEAVLPSGSWWHGPDGVLLLRGSGIAAGERQEDADLQDLVPTALYLLGLPLGRDMRGRILRKAFDPGFLERHQVLFIPSYPSAS
jgi:predicted AlkP superfamily phosphohydrolase/phosphomutase